MERPKQTSTLKKRTMASSQNPAGSRTKTSSRSSLTSSQNRATQDNSVPKTEQTSRTVLYVRISFVLLLMGVATAFGYGSYRLTSDSQAELAAERFESISERALSTAQLVLEEKKQVTDGIALMVAVTNPDASVWPFVYMAGFEEIATSLKIVTEGSISFCPIVEPGGEEQQAFEDFAYNLFYNVQGYPQDTGVSDFGRGVFSFGNNEFGNATWPDHRFHITSGWTYHGSPREILVPFIQSDFGPHPSLMLNVNFEHNRAAVIDDIMTCSEKRAKAQDEKIECGGITELMWSATQADVDPGPAGLIFVPIYPRSDKFTLTGFIVGKQIWYDLLKHGFESDVNGLHVVLRTERQAHTYLVVNGEVEYVGEGDLSEENPTYSDSAQINPNFFSDTAVKYYMDIYSTQEFEEKFENNDPVAVSVGAVCIVLMTSLLFLCYDALVRREFNHKRQLLEAKRRFVRFISHEVRTPLNTVCMGLTLLKQDLQPYILKGSFRTNSTEESLSTTHEIESSLVQEWVNLVDQVHSNATESVNVLSDLLHYDKIQMGTLKLELSIIDIWQMLEQIVGEFQIAAQERGMRLHLDLTLLTQSRNDSQSEVGLGCLSKDLRRSVVVGDVMRLQQVFRNLISNGLKFSKSGDSLTISPTEILGASRKHHSFDLDTKGSEEKERVTLETRSSLLVHVVDQGIGMSPEQVATVFDDGTQFNANKLQAGGGSGLGLHIARGIVLEHGGSLTCSSKGLGRGTMFTLELPLYVGEDDSTDNDEEALAAPKPLSASGKILEEPGDDSFEMPKLRILVVDDSVTNRKLCMRLLEKKGHTCEGAQDGGEAVTKVKHSLDSNEPYDCILLDYEMPNMKGPEACRIIREMGCSSYVSGLTGNVMSEDVEHFRQSGANWVLHKPFKICDLEEQWIEHGVGPLSKINESGNRFHLEVSETPPEGMDDDLVKSLREDVAEVR